MTRLSWRPGCPGSSRGRRVSRSTSTRTGTARLGRSRRCCTLSRARSGRSIAGSISATGVSRSCTWPRIAAKRSHLLGEYFSQLEDLEARAKWIHEYLQNHGAPDHTRIWGDAANPTDIVEINKEFRRLGSPYRVRPVLAERKLRRPSVTKINNLLHRGALLVRRDIGEFMAWRLRMNAASDGQQILGSRLRWEINNWRYPAPKDGMTEAQKQDPDDDTADGADTIAALRYAVMSYYQPPKRKLKPKRKDPNIDTGLDELAARLDRQQRRAA